MAEETGLTPIRIARRVGLFASLVGVVLAIVWEFGQGADDAAASK